MVSWVGFRQTGVEYTREERFAGHSKYPFHKLLQLGMNGFLSFSDAPLRIALRVGLAMSVLSIFVGIAAIGIKMPGCSRSRHPLTIVCSRRSSAGSSC